MKRKKVRLMKGGFKHLACVLMLRQRRFRLPSLVNNTASNTVHCPTSMTVWLNCIFGKSYFKVASKSMKQMCDTSVVAVQDAPALKREVYIWNSVRVIILMRVVRAYDTMNEVILPLTFFCRTFYDVTCMFAARLSLFSQCYDPFHSPAVLPTVLNWNSCSII